MISHGSVLMDENDEKPLMTSCPSCGGHKVVSPMVLFWGADPAASCLECRGAGEIEVCRTCKGSGTREPDPGEPAPPVGPHRCRRCKGWGTLATPATTRVELGVPADLPWLVEVAPTGRARILHFYDCDLSQRQYLYARAVRMELIRPDFATILAPGWEVNEPEETAASSKARTEPGAGKLAAPPRRSWWRRLLGSA